MKNKPGRPRGVKSKTEGQDEKLTVKQRAKKITKIKAEQNAAAFPDIEITNPELNYTHSGRSNNFLFHLGQKYIRNNAHGDKIYWKCTKWHAGCRGRAITRKSDPNHCTVKNDHYHPLI